MTRFIIDNGVLSAIWSDEETIRIPDNVRGIADFALRECKHARHVYIPQKVRSIDDYAFAIPNIEDVQVHPDNKRFFSREGVLFERKKTDKGEKEKLIYYPKAKKAEAYVIPDTVTDIVDNTFRYVNYLKSLTFPDSLGIESFGSFIEFPEIVEEIVIPSISNISWPRLLGVKSVKIYPSKYSKPPHRNFHKYYEENGSMFVRVELIGASSNHPLIHTMPIRYSKDITGEIYLLSELHRFCKEPFEGCDRITGVIALKHPISANGYSTEIDFDLGRPIPLTMPRIYFSKAANEATKINLLLGYLAHPEFYNDDSGYAEGMYKASVARQKSKLLPCIFQMDRPDLLKYYADRHYITKSNLQELFLTPAREASAHKCVEFLSLWQQERDRLKNSQLQIEDGLQLETTVADKKKAGESLWKKRVLRCDPKKTGDVVLPFDVAHIEKNAFDGCDGVTAIIAPKFAEENFTDTFCERKTIPLVFPLVDFKSVKNKVTKTNLLLGYLAHPEYYDDIVTGYFSSNTLGEGYLDYAVRMKRTLLPYVFALDRPEMLEFYAIRKLIDKKNFELMYMTPAREADAEKCIAFLKKWEAEYL